MGLGLIRGTSKIPVLNEFLYGLCMSYVNYHRGFISEFHQNGERQILETLGRLFERKVVFFDVGANVGSWTKNAIGSFHEYHGHVFEMCQPAYEVLRSDQGHNHALMLNHCALSDKTGEIEYVNYGDTHTCNTMITSFKSRRTPLGVLKTLSKRGDDYCDEHQIGSIDFLKIDTEGAELFVLKGFENRLSSLNVAVIQFEYSGNNVEAHTIMADFYVYLTPFGYVLGPLRRDGVKFKEYDSSDNDFRSGPNYVACLPKYREALANF